MGEKASSTITDELEGPRKDMIDACPCLKEGYAQEESMEVFDGGRLSSRVGCTGRELVGELIRKDLKGAR